MEIQSEMHENILILRPFGRLDRAGARHLDEMARAGMEDGSSRMAIDFSQTEAISSDGLRSVLGAGTGLRARQGEIALAGLKPELRALFSLSGMLALFGAFDSLDQALEHLRSHQPGPAA
ncbi:MAG: STAS domain-containing protein [Noviherbaspirillum sp.]